MRELSVYYCPRCGYYGYFQLVRNAVCPSCDIKLSLLTMRYQDFMKLTLEERDSLLIHEIISGDGSITNRISAAERAHNTRKLVAAINARLRELESENRQLNDTVEWMHQTIWDLLVRNKELQRQAGQPDPSSGSSEALGHSESSGPPSPSKPSTSD